MDCDPSHPTINHSSSVANLPPASLEKRPARWRWWIHLLIIAALPVIAGTAGGKAHGNGPALGHSAVGVLRASVLEVLFFGVFLAAAWLFSRASKDDLLLRWRPGPLVLPLGAIYSVAIRLIVAAVAFVGVALAMLVAHVSTDQLQSFFQANRPKVEVLVDMHAMVEDPVYRWLNVVVVSFLVGGLREELWRSSFLAGLRALWPRTFESTRGGILAAGVAALFFGFGHLPQGWLTVGIITIVGFLLGVIMVLHRSIWPSVVAHGCFDAASMAMLAWVIQNVPMFQQLQKG